MANITTQTIRVDLSTGKVIPTAYTHQNDTARTLVFDMYNGGLPYTMTGNTVKFAYKSPVVNGQYSVIAGASMASGTVSGNTVSVTLPVAYTQISGVGMLTMIITPSSGTIRPVNIRLVVQKSADGDDEIMGASDWPEGLYEYMDDWLAENEPTEIANLKSDLDYLGFSESSFAYVGGEVHASTEDRVFIKIKNGEKFTISVKSSDNSSMLVTPFAYRADGTGDQLQYISFTGESSKEYIASSDYVSVGLYIGNGFPSSDIVFMVQREDSILYVAPLIESIDEAVSNIIYSNSAHFDSNDFQRGGINGSTGALINYQFRVCSYGHEFKFEYSLKINANTGFRFGVVSFDSNGNVISDSGWKTEYIVPANTIFKISIGRTTETTSETADVNYFVSQLYIETKSASEIRELQPQSANYYYNGNMLDFLRHGYNISDLFNVPTKPTEATGSQAFAINNGVLFQLYNDNKVTLVDFSNGSVIGTLDINCDHGDSIDFSNEFYNQSDEFPLAYITADTTPAKVYVVRITRNATSLIRTLYFGDISKTGYMAGHCLDKYNNALYMVGYTENSYYLDESGTNLMIVSKWDLNNCTTNQDGTITPAFVESFTTPFIRTAQGQQYFREKIYIVSSHNLAGGYPIDTKVYVIDPFKRIVTNILTDFPTSIKDVETEGIDFVLDGTEYSMILGNTKYYQISFT